MNDTFTTFDNTGYQNTCGYNPYSHIEVNQFGGYDVYSNGKIVREHLTEEQLANYGHQAITNFLLTGVYFGNI